MRNDKTKHRYSTNNSTTTRGLFILKMLVDYPEQYTRKELAVMFEVHIDTIKKYFRSMKHAGFDVKSNGYPAYTYYVANIEKVKYAE